MIHLLIAFVAPLVEAVSKRLFKHRHALKVARVDIAQLAARNIQLERNSKTVRETILADGVRIQELLHEIEYLRAQLMNVRVCQSEDHNHIGWEVCAYIPQSVVDHLIAHPTEVPTFEKFVSDRLVNCAVKGLIHVNKRGRINALMFAPVNLRAPAAPTWVAAVFEDGGISERCPQIPDKSKLRLVDPKEGQLKLPPA